MPTAASSIIRGVSETLGDLAHVRWPVPRLVRYLNDGQRDIITHRPDAGISRAAITLASAGHRHALPAGSAKLIDIHGHAGASQAAVRKLSNWTAIDCFLPDWRSATPVAVIEHWMYDARDPLAFEVYPPAQAGVQLDASISMLPTDIAAPAGGDAALWSDVVGNIYVADLFANPLRDYILFRAHSENNRGSLPARAMAHFEAYARALGVEVQATAALAASSAETKGAES